MRGGTSRAALLAMALAGAAGFGGHGSVASGPEARAAAERGLQQPAKLPTGGFFNQISRAFLSSGRGTRGGRTTYRKRPLGSHKQKRRIQMAVNRRKQRGGTVAEVLIVLAAVVAFTTAVNALLIPVAAKACEARWADSGLKTRYGTMSGCLVQMPDGRWLPDDRVREVAP